MINTPMPSMHPQSMIQSLTMQSKNPTGVRLHTIRKSGTNLLNKLLELMQVPQSAYRPQQHIDAVNVKKMNPNTTYIISVRDPRDMLISYANWLVNSKSIEISKNNGVYDKETTHRLLDMSLEERINYIFDGDNGVKILNGYRNVLTAKKLHPDNVHLIKFEDFIGPKFGGASKKVQLKTVGRIAKLCRKKISPERLKNLSKEMIGDTPTFTSSKNKVNGWKTTLTPDQILRVHDLYNDFILGLGYETEPDWHLQYT